MEGKKQIGVYIPLDLYEAYCEYHNRTGVSKIKIVELALRNYLNKQVENKTE